MQKQSLWSSRPSTCTNATTSIFLRGGGGRAINRQTAIFVAASPHGKKKSNTVTALLMAPRATTHQSTGVPPFTLMTGGNMMLPLHLLYHPGDLNLVTAYTTHQYMEELHQHLRTTFAFVQQQLQRSVEGRKAYYDQKASNHEFNVGDKVWYYSFAQPRQNGPHRLSKKFLPHWTEPHKIVDKLLPVAYRIQIRQGRSKPVLRWVHRNQIKRHQGSSRQEKREDQTH